MSVAGSRIAARPGVRLCAPPPACADTGAPETLATLATLASRVEQLPDRVLLYVDEGDETLAAVHHAGLTPVSALVRRSSLEDVFLRLTGRTLVD